MTGAVLFLFHDLWSFALFKMMNAYKLAQLSGLMLSQIFLKIQKVILWDIEYCS